MVDSRKDKTMADGLDNLPERVQAVEQKLDALSTSLDDRFDQVDAAMADQRLFTEFAYGRLDSKMDAGFARIDQHFAQVDGRLAQVDGRLAQIDSRLAHIDSRFAHIDSRFAQIDSRFAKVDGSFARLDRKLDRFIDTQSKTNELVERRLRLWEPPT
ncbi:MAG: hypothetical protein H0W08_13750 [Acidobacteria bacterium]|nr:hypothetical protein [Acidobacteriota bacterium]